jgi:hypothetical protein
MTVALPAITGNEFEDRDIWRGVDSLLDQYMSVDGSDRIGSSSSTPLMREGQHPGLPQHSKFEA